MNSLKLATVFSVLAVSAFAQSESVSAVETQTGGLIGKKYVSAGIGYIDVNHSGYEVFATGLDVNVPLNSLVDITTSFSHSWGEGNDMNTNQNLSVGAVSYLAQGNVKPFVSVDLGYTWTAFNDEGMRYGIGAGAEYTFCEKLALKVSANFDDGFHRRTQSDTEFSGNAELNYWATSKLFVGVGATLIEGGHFGFSTTVGYRF